MFTFFCPQVDSQNKMKSLIGDRCSSSDYSCVLVHYPYTDPFLDSQEIDLSILSEAERDLIEHCELNWHYPQPPVVKLPEKWKIIWTIIIERLNFAIAFRSARSTDFRNGFGVQRHLVFIILSPRGLLWTCCEIVFLCRGFYNVTMKVVCCEIQRYS